MISFGQRHLDRRQRDSGGVSTSIKAVISVFVITTALLIKATAQELSDGAVATWRDGHCSSFGEKERKQYVLSWTGPQYAYEVRKSRISGAGRYEVQIDRSGRPNKVSILKSSGNRILDQEAIQALLAWRFKPGALQTLQVPVTWKIGF
jgi:TonB family protein